MLQKWYTISFQAKLNEDDIHAMNKCFYETMSESVRIDECCALDIDSHCEQD